MIVRNRTMGPCVRHEGARGTRVLPATLVSRLLLSDTYVLESHDLKEFLQFAHGFGFEATLELLDSGAIEIKCDALYLAQTGHLEQHRHIQQRPVLPLFSYCLEYAEQISPSPGPPTPGNSYADQCLEDLTRSGSLGRRDLDRLAAAVANRILPRPPDLALEATAAARGDVVADPRLVAVAIARALSDRLGRRVSVADLGPVEIDPLNDADFAVITDLPSRFALTEADAHETVMNGLMAAGGVAWRFAQMRGYEAVSGFDANDSALVEAKLSGLLRALGPSALQQQFSRVIELGNLPNPRRMAQVDLHRVLEVRASSELRDFRQWLEGAAREDDAVVAAQLQSLGDSLKGALGGSFGKTVRFAASALTGLLPVVGVPAGLAAGLVDTFIIDRFLSARGPLYFMSHVYPTLFHPSPDS